jgi:predicted dehydrogenase
MNFGVIGCRHAHIEAFISEMLKLGHRFTGIAEREPHLALTLASQYGVPLLETADLIKTRPEIIGTSAINNEKIGIVELCENYGIHVMADKPLLTSMNDYERLASVVRRSRIKIGIMLTERFDPLVYTLKNLVSGGTLGRLISLTTIKPHRLAPPTRSEWHFDREKNGGILIDLLIHDYDLLRWFSGSEIVESYGYMIKSGHPEYASFYDSVHMTALTGNNVVGLLEADWWTPEAFTDWGDTRILCLMTRGRAEIKLAGDHLTGKKPYLWISSWDKDAEAITACQVPTDLTRDFIDRINGKPDTVITDNDILCTSLALLEADKTVKIVR